MSAEPAVIPTAVPAMKGAGPPLGVFPQVRSRVVHGYRRAYRMAGKGPAVLLLHGIGDNSETWAEVMPALARDHLVIAPDMLGHGASDKPRADYSIAGFANGMRDLLSILGIERATVVGHSLGAGVAMQFAYQYPERCERLVLVGAGGVSREVNVALRAATLPGAKFGIGLLRTDWFSALIRNTIDLLVRLDTDIGLDAGDLVRVIEDLPDLPARAAFVRTLRSAIDVRGQYITMLDRSYLAAGMPTLLVWGSRDAIIPIHHARIAHAALPGSRLEIFEGSGHFPFHDDPQRFVGLVQDFVTSTLSATMQVERWRELLRNGRDDPALQPDLL